jgi:hypothetical protein
MSKVCDFCRSTCAADAETTCPAWGTRLCSLLLPAADLRAPSAALTPPLRWEVRSRLSRGPGAPWERWVASPLLYVAIFVLIVAGVWTVSDRVRNESGPGRALESSGRIRVGMHISEVGRLLDRGPPPSPSYPRMRDYFPADEFGDGTIDYEGDGVVLKIDFVRGRVTSVEESPSSAGPGFHRYTMIVRQR